jgi:tRNA A-37 threonylcarbamoyl transferase component Bud32
MGITLTWGWVRLMLESLEDRLWETMFRDGQRLLREGKHEQAVKEFKAALNISAKFEADDPRRTQSLNGLAIAHTVRQEFADAEPLFKAAVEMHLSQTNGEEDLELARVLKHLALVYHSQHKGQQAEECYLRALKIYERLAPQHSDVNTIKQQIERIHKRSQEIKHKVSDNDMLVIVKSKPNEAPMGDNPHAPRLSPPAPAASTDQAGKPPVGVSAVRHEFRTEVRPMPLEDMVGKVLDERYEVLERVAAGGMSVIYKARHALLDRMVAIKVMHPHLVSNLRNVKRFSQEAKTACGLTHPNIVTVRDFGVTKDGLCYIVMDYVEGETLATRINREHHILDKDFVPLFQQVVDALMYAHEMRVLHRDLKPSNIMIVPGRKPGDPDILKLVDFGIAKMVSNDEEQLSLTQTGETVGSPLYMSPEQCRGLAVDHRSDIYSLGCLAYKSLTGFPPFLGSSDIDVYFKHINEEAPSFTDASPDLEVNEELEKIVIQSLQKSPSKRQQSMEELRKQLDQLQF